MARRYFGFSVFRFKNSKERTPIESTKGSLMQLCALCLARQHQDPILKPQAEIHLTVCTQLFNNVRVSPVRFTLAVHVLMFFFMFYLI